jgi:chromosome segregation ATPase
LPGNTQQPPADHFLLVDDAAQSLNLSSKVLRQGIACGLVPIRRDNSGAIRVHLDEVPDGLEDKLQGVDVQDDLHAAALADEVFSLEQRRADADTQRLRLEGLITKQGAALARYASLLDMSKGDFDAPIEALAFARQNLAERDAEVGQLSSILERTFSAIDMRDQQVAQQTGQLTDAADKAMSLLSRAVREGELSSEQLQTLNQQISSSTNTSVRLEHELDQRNSVIDNQNGLMERMVTLAEQAASSSSTKKRRKRSFWQRLFGGGKGI